MSEVNISKGSRIRARWFEADTTCLAGMQPKLGATLRSIIGTVRHIRADNPTNPTKYRIYVQPDSKDCGSLCEKCGTLEVELEPQWIREVLEV